MPMITGPIMPGIMLPNMEPTPRAEDREARSESLVDMADSREPMGILNIV